MADFQKLSSLLDKTLQFAGESEDERNPDAQRLTSNSESFETRSLPTLAHCFPRNFTFYVPHPIRSIREQAAQRPTSATAVVQGLGVAAALVWVLPWA